jgi:hypothetical protein
VPPSSTGNSIGNGESPESPRNYQLTSVGRLPSTGFTNGAWSHFEFKGRGWQRIRAPDRKRYLENTYRVLLTRARQGMVIVVPPGDPTDPTRNPSFYDPTFDWLKRIGIPEL